MIEIKKENEYKITCDICESDVTIFLEKDENIIAECHNHNWLVINGNGVLKVICPFCHKLIAEEFYRREEKHVFM